MADRPWLPDLRWPVEAGHPLDNGNAIPPREAAVYRHGLNRGAHSQRELDRAAFRAALGEIVACGPTPLAVELTQFYLALLGAQPPDPTPAIDGRVVAGMAEVSRAR